jgi:FtsP/CotA-like multicopper oxidase with cupredoxin domain
MNTSLSRRRFLTSSCAALAANGLTPRGAIAGMAGHLLQEAPQAKQSAPPATVSIRATKRTLEIDGKSATVMGLLQPNGAQGISTALGQPFRVAVKNELVVPTAIHWHGLHPPNNQDGVPGVTQPVIRTDATILYDFPVAPAGTHWMHSHQNLQEAFLLAAPLIVHDPNDRAPDEQEVVIFLSDYSFTSPMEIYARLRGGDRKISGSPNSMAGMSKPAGTSDKMSMSMDKPDANDVNYDAYLANDRTLNDPEVVQVEKSGRVRLRIINGSSGTNFFIELGTLDGELIATDGIPVKPLPGRRFPVAIAQRIDVRVTLPTSGAFPILALREFASEQTGIILASRNAPVRKLPARNSQTSGLLTLDMEKQCIAVQPLPAKTPDQTSVLRLQGDMRRYEWMINGRAFNVADPGSEPAGVRVKSGQRVWLKFINETPMSHPMQLHGHSFQVVAINDQPLQGAVRDTILVTGKTSVTVALDANNPGLWYVHCHVLWHLAAGMATLVQYQA